MNMILGKKQIILASLVLALGIAVYLNYRFANTDMNFVTSSQVAAETPVENYGDAKFVDNKEVTTTTTKGTPEAAMTAEYFSEAKLTRTKTRDEAVGALKVMLADAKLETEQKADLTLQAAALAKSIETEGKIENLIKAKGFTECMVYCDTSKVDVIVKSVDLLDSDVVQIRDIILDETQVPVENISIVPVK